MTPRTSVQLYSVRDQLSDLDDTLERLASLGVDAVEPFSVLDGELGPALRRHGLGAPSGQFPFLSDDVEFMGKRVTLPPASAVFDAAAALGVELLIDPIVEASRWQTSAEVDRTADRLNAASEQAADFGLRVGYHNHSFEFHARIGGISVYERFAGRLDEHVVLELDMFWAAAAGEDVVGLLERLGAQVRGAPREGRIGPERPVHDSRRLRARLARPASRRARRTGRRRDARRCEARRARRRGVRSRRRRCVRRDRRIGRLHPTRAIWSRQRRVIQPPSTRIVWPVIQSPALEQSRRRAPTRSSGGPDGLPGMPAAIASRKGESFGSAT